MSAGLEVADVFRRHGEAYRRTHDGHLGRVERRVMSAIELCRTAKLGGHTEVCSDCGLLRCAYNSCRNRHCPKCQGQARADWLEARQAGDCRIFCARGRFCHWLTNLSPKTTANCVLASHHSRGGRFHSWAA